MELKEKVAYIKGMMEGMEFDTATKEGKLLAAVVDVLEEMAKEVTNIDEDVDTLYDEVDAMSEDLEDVENFLFDEDGGDEDEDDYDEEYEAGPSSPPYFSSPIIMFVTLPPAGTIGYTIPQVSTLATNT